jgi:RNA ligase (TIGR02306 family)
VRKLATIRKIIDIQPIPKADAIEVATVDGWKVVVKKGEFSVGDLGVYFEVDSWMPETIAPFLSKGREYNGVPGERLRTIKLRGQLSQGLLLGVGILADKMDLPDFAYIQEGDDVSDLLGIQKWERAMNAQMAGMMKGNFPSFIPKTDQERAQNMIKEIGAAVDSGLEFEKTEKLEGSSITIYIYEGEFGVCSRNIDLKDTEGNAFWEIARRYNLEEELKNFGYDIAIQGELVGPGIQGNIYGLTQTDMYVYDIYVIKDGKYLNPHIRRLIVDDLGLKHVPVLYSLARLDSVPRLLELADGKSELADTLREGVVYKQVDGGMTFKTISNAYLLTEKE